MLNAHKEFELLALLASSPRRVFGRETLLEKVWGYDYAGETRTVDVHRCEKMLHNANTIYEKYSMACVGLCGQARNGG